MPQENQITANERVALHYERKAARVQGALSSMCLIWADKARAGRSNPLVRRVARIMSAMA